MRLRFPLNGIHKGFGTVAQPEGTTFDCLNVRPIDVLGNRARGGQRPALDKWQDGDQIGLTEQAVVDMAVIGSMR